MAEFVGVLASWARASALDFFPARSPASRMAWVCRYSQNRSKKSPVFLRSTQIQGFDRLLFCLCRRTGRNHRLYDHPDEYVGYWYGASNRFQTPQFIWLYTVKIQIIYWFNFLDLRGPYFFITHKKSNPFKENFLRLGWDDPTWRIVKINTMISASK